MAPCLLAILASVSPARSIVIPINGGPRLNDIANALSAPGPHRIRFSGKGYEDPGSLTLLNNGSDSIVFERGSTSDSALMIDGILLHLQGQKGTVIFRGLALRFKPGAALFDSNQSGNQHLLFDSCTVLGDSALQRKVFAWGGDGSSTIAIRNSQFAYTGSISLTGASRITIANSMFVSTGAITLSSGPGSVSLVNDLFNTTGLLSVSVTSSLEMRYVTANRAQFLLDGNLTAKCDIRGNYFANPPAKNALPLGGTARYATLIRSGSFDSALVSGNTRDSAWDGYDYFPAGTGATLFSDPSNTLTRTPKDAGVVWDWKIPNDNSHGAWNGPTPLPDYNLYPPNATLSLPVNGGQAVFTLSPSAFPRLITPKIGAVTYASSLRDSARSWFRKDTTLLLQGSPATVVSLTVPASADSGRPVLFTREATGFNPKVWNAGTGAIANPIPSAQEFIPALADQNVIRGTDIPVRGTAAPNPLILFRSVTRPGQLVFLDSLEAPSGKRIRPIRSGPNPIAFKFRTNAEGSDSVRFAVPKGDIVPFLADSLFFWLGQNAFVRARDSAEMYWGKAALGATNLAVLVERLALGGIQDPDTLVADPIKIIALSAEGHQLKIDSSFHPSRTRFPDMGDFGPAYAFSWPGRVSADKFSVIFPRADTLQKAYFLNEDKAVPIQPSAYDSRSLKIAFNVGDSARFVFLARKFMMPAGIRTTLSVRGDSVKNLLSSTPGDIDLAPEYQAADPDSSRWYVLARRGIILDSLSPQGDYLLLLQSPPPSHRDSLHALLRRDTGWAVVPVADSAGWYAVQVDGSVRAVALAEGLAKEDLNPARPGMPASIRIGGDTLALAAKLTPTEQKAFPNFRADLLSLDADGVVRIEESPYSKVEDSLKITLAANRMYSYKVVYLSNYARPSSDTDWIPLPGFRPSTASLQAAIPSRAALRQHLIGFPFDASYSANVLAGVAGDGQGKTTLRRLKPDGTWDLLATDASTLLRRGEGFLYAAAKPFQLKVGPSEYTGLAPYEITLDRIGWHLFSNPFPLPLPLTALRIDSSAVSMPQALVVDTLGARKQPVYTWPFTEKLRPFEGFLVYAFSPTQIIIDPSAAVPPPASPKREASAEPSGGSRISLMLSTPWGTQSAVLYRSGPYLPTPYMAPWSEEGEIPRFRVGGQGGWSYLKTSRLDSLAAEIEISVPEKSVYPLTVSAQGAEEGAEPGALRMFDWQTGAILDEDAMRGLALEKGTSRFTLFRGKAVGPGIDAFTRMLPADFTLAQNYPNPFRGSTRIRIGIPAGAGRVLEARLRILAMDGRVLEDRSLGAMGVGEHSLAVGSDSWRPGIYLYELNIRTAQRALSLRKKMAYGAVAR